jgi:hypothetical protein
VVRGGERQAGCWQVGQERGHTTHAAAAGPANRWGPRGIKLTLDFL